MLVIQEQSIFGRIWWICSEFWHHEQHSSLQLQQQNLDDSTFKHGHDGGNDRY